MKVLKWLDEHFEETLLVICLVLIACVCLVQVIIRNIPWIPSLQWAEEFCRFAWIWSVVILVPSLALCVRRLHDIGKSGWWQLISITGIGAIILIIWCAKDSTPGVNKYGPNPKGEGYVTFTTGETKEPWDL